MSLFSFGGVICDLLISVFEAWNSMVDIVFGLLIASPESFKDGGPWGIIEEINPIFVAVGSSLVVIFFVIGFCSESVDVKEEMRLEKILTLLVRLGLVARNDDEGHDHPQEHTLEVQINRGKEIGD